MINPLERLRGRLGIATAVKAWYSGKQELSMSSSHIILDFKSRRELGMVQSSINRGVIKQKIGLWGEGK